MTEHLCGVTQSPHTLPQYVFHEVTVSWAVAVCAARAIVTSGSSLVLRIRCVCIASDDVVNKTKWWTSEHDVTRALAVYIGTDRTVMSKELHTIFPSVSLSVWHHILPGIKRWSELCIDSVWAICVDLPIICCVVFVLMSQPVAFTSFHPVFLFVLRFAYLYLDNKKRVTQAMWPFAHVLEARVWTSDGTQIILTEVCGTFLPCLRTSVSVVHQIRSQTPLSV